MTSALHKPSEAEVVAAQLGRLPRDPWRVASLCPHGFPSTIASPSRLADTTPFPSWVWLTCPWLAELVAGEESAGGTDEWASRAAADAGLAQRLRATDAAVRAARARESGGEDACAGVGIAGQRDPLAVKCLHAHVALFLVGIEDPIGAEIVERYGNACPDRRCDVLALEGGAPQR